MLLRIRTMTANPYAGIVVRPFLRRAIPYIIGFRGCVNLTGPDLIEESGHPLNMLYFVAVTDRIAVIMRLIGITLFPRPDKLGVDPLPLQLHPYMPSEPHGEGDIAVELWKKLEPGEK